MQADGSQFRPKRQQPVPLRPVQTGPAIVTGAFSMPTPGGARDTGFLSGADLLAILPEHGGQVQAVMRYFPHAPLPYYDLSTGISPFAYPCRLPSQAALQHLPEQHQEEHLLGLAAQAYGVPSIDCVAAGAGSQSLIALLPYIVPAQQVCILGPTYAGHAQAWRLRGCSVVCVDQLEALAQAATQPGTVCVVCNPNNPDGRLLSASWLHAVAQTCAQHGGTLIVDEAFADFENQSVAPFLPHPALVVLRSFGKTYGLPGVRLGFLLAAPPLVERVRAVLGSWPVGTVALAVGAQALADAPWRAQAAQQARHAHARLVALLRKAGLNPQGECSLFTQLTHPKAGQLWQHFCHYGLVTRLFTPFCDRLRLGLPADDEAWLRLESALNAFAGLS